MFQIKKMSRLGYEDLMREFNSIEQQLIGENSSLAMELMVLEAKVRERFQLLDNSREFGVEDQSIGAPITMDDMQALIPRDLPPFPTLDSVQISHRKKRIFETVSMAALLATLTALGVFGLASALQLALGWLA